MELKNFLADNLIGNVAFLKNTVADVTDAELRDRPAPAANPGNWQIGHLVVALTQLFGFAKVPFPELPASFAPYRTKPAEGAAWLSKDELLSTLEQYTKIVADWARAATPEQLSMQTPEQLRGFAPTVMHLLSAVPTHNAMHIGQLQVLRRKLGKPVLF